MTVATTAPDDAAPPAISIRSTHMLLLLGIMGVLMSLWSDMLIPVLPALQTDLRASASQAQQVVSLFLLASAFMALWHGVLADALGRRVVLLGSLGLLTLTSLACLLVTRMEYLWALRMVQGLAAGSGVILGRAIISDLYSGEVAQRMLARTSLIQTAGPIVLPVLAGWLTVLWGWRAVFGSLGAVGALMLIVYARKLPESLPPERRQPLNARNILHGYRLVIGSAQFVRVSLAHGLNWVALFIYVAGAAQFLVTLLGRSVTEMYLVFGPVRGEASRQRSMFRRCMSSVCADEIPFEVVELTTLERVDWFNHRRQSMPRPLATWQPLLEDAFAVTSTPGARRDRRRGAVARPDRPGRRSPTTTTCATTSSSYGWAAPWCIRAPASSAYRPRAEILSGDWQFSEAEP